MALLEQEPAKGYANGPIRRSLATPWGCQPCTYGHRFRELHKGEKRQPAPQESLPRMVLQDPDGTAHMALWSWLILALEPRV